MLKLGLAIVGFLFLLWLLGPTALEIMDNIQTGVHR